METSLLAQSTLPGGRRLQLLRGDLTQQHVDAIVNAANEHLAHGGGVAAAIVRAGGDVIQRESDAWVQAHGPASHTRAAVTSAGALPCRYVIHAVGPVWGSGDEDTKLSQAVRSALDAAAVLNLQTLAMPPISTGIFGFPKRRAAGIFFDTIRACLAAQSSSALREVSIVIIDSATASEFIAAFIPWKLQNEALAGG